MVAHRGDSAHLPENTLAAALRAVEVGADALEVDVRLTLDGEPVLFHDAGLRRLTGIEGEVERTKLGRLRDLRVGSGGDGAPIPTLRELVAAMPESFPLNLELKRRHAGIEDLLQAVSEVIGERGSVLVSSFDRELLDRSRELRPDLCHAPVGSRDADELVEAAGRLEAWSLHAHRRLVDEELIEWARSRGRFLLVYTVDDPGEAEALFARGVAGVFADDPGRLVGIRDRWRSRRGPL